MHSELNSYKLVQCQGFPQVALKMYLLHTVKEDIFRKRQTQFFFFFFCKTDDILIWFMHSPLYGPADCQLFLYLINSFFFVVKHQPFPLHEKLENITAYISYIIKIIHNLLFNYIVLIIFLAFIQG